MWTTVLASYAAVVSTSGLIVSYISYRSGGPQLSGTAKLYREPGIAGSTLQVAVRNRGRGAVTIDSMRLWGTGPASVDGKSQDLAVGWPLTSMNTRLPLRIEGHSGERWTSSASRITKEWLTRPGLTTLSMTILQADGKFLELAVDTSMIDALDPKDLPDSESDSEENGEPFTPGEWL
jgi:hypothetical protein